MHRPSPEDRRGSNSLREKGMLSKEEIIEKAEMLGFADAGFTTVEPFPSQKALLLARREKYAWAIEGGLDLIQGTDPLQIYPDARSIIVLIEPYYRMAFPRFLEGHFGRCYLDDDRMTKDGLSLRVKAFRSYLREAGMESKVPSNLPHRLTAARCGLGTLGKNNFFYARRGARGGSWTSPITIMVDREFPPDEPTVKVGCPAWCRNACIAACPTRAIEGPGKIDPRKCISYLSYYGKGITPIELRDQMGMWVYGCDRCQNVCPRNHAWMAQPLALNEKVAARADDFDLFRLLAMDAQYYRERIWPHMFYMPENDLWRWQMNAARAMGNSEDPKYIADLITVLQENADHRVRGMAAWPSADWEEAGCDRSSSHAFPAKSTP